MSAAWPDLRVPCARVRPGDPGREAYGQGKPIKGKSGAGSVHGRDSAHDQQWLLRGERCRAGHRVQLHRSPLRSSTRPWQRRTPRAKLLFSARIISLPRGSWLDFGSIPRITSTSAWTVAARLPVTILLKAIGMTPEGSTTFTTSRTSRSSGAAPVVRPGADRLRGEMAKVRGHDASSKVIVTRTAHHHQAHPRAGQRRHRDGRGGR